MNQPEEPNGDQFTNDLLLLLLLLYPSPVWVMQRMYCILRVKPRITYFVVQRSDEIPGLFINIPTC